MEQVFALEPQFLIETFDELIPAKAVALTRKDEQKAIPVLAKDPELMAQIETVVRRLPTRHRLLLGDSREAISQVSDQSVHLVVTSPPYWTLKEYPKSQGQLGAIEEYENFIEALDEVWRQAFRRDYLCGPP